MGRHYSIFILTVVASLQLATCLGQNKIIDSLEKVLLTGLADTNRVDALNSLTYRYKYNNKDRALLLSDEAETLAKKLNYRKGLAANYYCRAYVLQIAGAFPEAVSLLEQGLEIAETDHDLKRQAFCHGLLGIIYGQWTNHTKAIQHNLKASDLFEKIGDTLTLAAIKTNIGTLYEERGVYDSALVFYFQSLDYKRSSGNAWACVTELANIGAAYHLLEEYPLSLDYNWQGIQQSLLSPNRPVIDHLYMNRGQVFLDLNQLDSASFYAQAAYEIAKGRKRPYQLLPILKLLGELNHRTGKMERAIQFFQEGFDLASEIGNLDFQSSIACELGGLYLEQDKPSKAVKVLEQAYKTGEELKGYVHLECASRQLALAYEQAGNYQQAVQFLKFNRAHKDSLSGLEKSKHLVELERQYRSQLQARELAEKDLTLSRQGAQMRNFIIGALAVLLMLLGLFQYFRYRTKLRGQQTKTMLKLERNRAEYLEELGQAKSNFFANISHEFRTPLSLILGPLKKAEEQLTEQEAPSFQVSETWKDSNLEVTLPARHLSMMRRNSERLQQLIDQLLDLSKLESGSLKLRVAEGDVVSFVRAMVFSFESLAERRQIRFETSFPKKGQMAFYDKDKLEKIIVNLLSNAFKYTPEKGNVAVKTILENGQLAIEIADNGPGISKKDLAKIFERFYQVEGTEDQGTGIGLSLVKELVELHKGQISVESEGQNGTKFKVSLPIAKEAFETKNIVDSKFPQAEILSVKTPIPNSLPIPEKASDPHQSPIINQQSPPLLLIVEDNPDLRHFIAETMQNDYQILTAENGKIGMETAIEHLPDLIISDVMMPEMNGFDMCQTLKKDERSSHIPIVLLTAKAGQGHKVEGLETGADAYLTKPFDEKELRVRAKNLVEQRQRLRERFAGVGRLEGVQHLSPGEVAVTSTDQRFLEKVSAAIEQNMDNEFFSVEDLASLVAFSRSQLHRKLKALTGKSPNGLIREFRMARAKELLEKGAGNVSEVAMEVGYSSLSYFTRSFKQAFGVLPSEV